MQSQQAEQREALETLLGFNERLIQNMKIITDELTGARLADTDKLLKSIMDAINWEISVMNATMAILNEGKERIHKEQFNKKIMAFGEAVQRKDDEKIAAAIQELIMEFETLGEAAKDVLA